MATESITHVFHFEGEAALRFANVVEESLKGPGLAADFTTKAVELRGEEIRIAWKTTSIKLSISEIISLMTMNKSERSCTPSNTRFPLVYSAVLYYNKGNDRPSA